jgi:NhaP-type Na+/H+ or K+/H+ antiporter
VLHALASVIAWVIAIAVGLSLLGLLAWLLRVILRDSARKPRMRALMLIAFAFGLFVLWSASRVVP